MKKKSFLKKAHVKAALISVLYQISVIGLFYLIDIPLFKRFMTLLGGDISNGGIIQGFIVFTSAWAFLDIRDVRKRIKSEFRGLCLSLLPTGDRHVLLPMDLPAIQEKIASLRKEQRKLLVVRLLLSGIGKFKSTMSMPETIDVISLQSDINREIHESEQSNIRYLLWLVPSIGFMGTVIGISQALSIASDGDMNAITQTLGVAFDTTLISLILSAVVTGLFHKLQEETDKLHANVKEYVISNFVNRLEIKKFSNEANSSSKKAG